jgi:transcription elongation factor Elf1
MTMKSTRDVTCTNCGLKTEVVFWNTLNAQINPEDKQLLLEGKVNLFECPSCGHQAWLNTQMLFHDMEQEYVVYLFYPDQIDSPKFLNSFSKSGSYHVDPGFEIPKSSAYFKNPHYVFSMDELVTYIQFRDRLFELNKSRRKRVKQNTSKEISIKQDTLPRASNVSDNHKAESE